MACSGRGWCTLALNLSADVVVRRETYLQVADGQGPEDLNVGCVGVGEGLAVPQPHNGYVSGMGLDLARDVHAVPLPGVRRNLTVDLW